MVFVGFKASITQAHSQEPYGWGPGYTVRLGSWGCLFKPSIGGTFIGTHFSGWTVEIQQAESQNLRSKVSFGMFWMVFHTYHSTVYSDVVAKAL